MSEESAQPQDFTPWIKVKVNLPGHRKTLQLKRELGLSSRHEAAGIIVDLWCQTYLNVRADGDWSKWDGTDLEDKIGWRGDPGDLIKALQKTGFMDGLTVHDWNVVQRQRIRESEKRQGTPWSRPAPNQEDPNEPRRRAKATLERQRK